MPILIRSVFFLGFLFLCSTAYAETQQAPAKPPENTQPAQPAKTPDGVTAKPPVQPASPSTTPAQPLPPPVSQPKKVEKKVKVVEIGLFQLEANGVDKRITNILTDAIHAQLVKLPNSKIISSKEIDTMMGFEEKKQLSGCKDTSCVVAISGALGVEKLILGSVGKLGTMYLINLKLLNTYEGRVESMFDKRVEIGDDEENAEEYLIELLPEAMQTLFPANAVVWPKEERKKPKEITSAGPWPWVMTGLGAGAVIAGGILTYSANTQYQDWKKMRLDDPKLKSTQDQIRAKEISAYVLYGVGGAAVVGGLVWYFVVEDQIAKKKAAKAKKKQDQQKQKTDEKKKADIEFQPLLGSVYGGSLSVRW